MRVPRAISLQNPRTQMQSLTRTYMVAIKDYDNMTTMNENVKRM